MQLAASTTTEPGEGSTEPPADAPTAPPTDGPSTDPGAQGLDPNAAYEEALRGAQTVAVAEAQRLMHEGLAAVDAAEKDVEAARAEAEEAAEAEEEAKRQLKIAEQVIERTAREIQQIKGQTDDARAAVGTVVIEAYQNNGLSTVGVILGAETPEELSDRYVGLRTLLRASDTALGRLAEDQADLRNALSQLEGQRKEKEQRAEEAAERRVESEAAEDAAEAAQAELEERLEEYEHALNLAEEALLEDYQLYMEQLDEATAVGEYLERLAEEEEKAARSADAGDGGAAASSSGASGSGSGTFVRPGTGSVTSRYGQRLHPILGYVKMHTGIDFGRGDGKIYAADSGTVVEATFNRAYGYMVIIDHGVVDGQRLSTLYAHQSGLMVQAGQQVEKGQVIGSIGSTGYSTGPHLHFEVRLNGQHTDPAPWLDGAPNP